MHHLWQLPTKTRFKQGLTILELLVVVSLISAVGVVAMPALLHARKSALMARETAYAQNVYKVINAYLVEDPTLADLPSGAEVCTGQYSVGGYSAGTAPNTLNNCRIVLIDGYAAVVYSGEGASKTLGAPAGTIDLLTEAR